MDEPGDDVERPRFSRAAVQQLPDGVRIVLPSPGVWGSRERNTILGLLVAVGMFTLFSGIAAGFTLSEVGERATLDDFGALIGMSVYVFLGLAVLIGYLIPAGRSAELTTRGGRLTISVRGWFAAWASTWATGEILALGGYRGLWIVDGKGRRQFLRERRDEELVWVAQLLRKAIGVGTCPPPGPGELAVVTSLRSLENQAGLLTVRPGRIVIRHGFCLPLDMRIEARRGSEWLRLSSVRPGSTVRIVAEDVVCSGSEDGSVLEVLLPGGARGLTVWCADPQGMPRTLARFWGAADE